MFLKGYIGDTVIHTQKCRKVSEAISLTRSILYISVYENFTKLCTR